MGGSGGGGGGGGGGAGHKVAGATYLEVKVHRATRTKSPARIKSNTSKHPCGANLYKGKTITLLIHL